MALTRFSTMYNVFINNWFYCVDFNSICNVFQYHSHLFNLKQYVQYMYFQGNYWKKYKMYFQSYYRQCLSCPSFLNRYLSATIDFLSTFCNESLCFVIITLTIDILDQFVIMKWHKLCRTSNIWTAIRSKWLGSVRDANRFPI